MVAAHEDQMRAFAVLADAGGGESDPFLREHMGPSHVVLYVAKQGTRDPHDRLHRSAASWRETICARRNSERLDLHENACQFRSSIRALDTCQLRACCDVTGSAKYKPNS